MKTALITSLELIAPYHSFHGVQSAEASSIPCWEVSGITGDGIVRSMPFWKSRTSDAAGPGVAGMEHTGFPSGDNEWSHSCFEPLNPRPIYSCLLGIQYRLDVS